MEPRVNSEIIKSLASRYIWWKSPEEAALMTERVIAQVMNIGDYADVLKLVNAVGEDVLRDVLENAQAGQFNERSWHYWHYRLGLSKLDEVPPLPVRSFS